MKSLRARAVLPFVVLVSACGSSEPAEKAAPPPTEDEAPLAPYDPDACAHLRGGAKGANPPASDLGRAHALVRYFTAEEDVLRADTRLAEALEGAAPGSPEATRAYAKAAGLCAASAEESPLGAASVTLQGDVAIVAPGTGPVVVPPEARAVALDLRTLPDSADARAALVDALAAVLSTEVRLLDAEERKCHGQPDEVYGLVAGIDIDVYGCAATVAEGLRVQGKGQDRPIAVLTAAKLSPLAAYAAVSLRSKLGAFVIGESVPAVVAESQWVGIGGEGLGIRTRRLLTTPTKRLPDIVDADLRTSDPARALGSFDFSGERPELATSPVTRKKIGKLPRPTAWGAKANSVGYARAALVSVYAATRTAFPYFDVVGDTIDARLDEALSMVATKADDRAVVERALSRFTEALHDSHVVVYDKYAAPAEWGSLALVEVGSELVVARSTTPDVKPGDAIVTIDGAPAASRLPEAISLISGSPQTARYRAVERLVPPRSQLTVKSPAGEARAVTVTPTDTPAYLFGAFDRPPGTLDDLGAPDVYYVSLNDYARKPIQAADVPSIQAAMVGKRGVVLDMRGYPSIPGWDVLAWVADPSSVGPQMADLLVTPRSRTVLPDQPTQVLSEMFRTRQGYTGPVVLLVGNETQSQAEHLTTFFKSKRRGLVVGTKTSGANGVITGVQLPGGYGVLFTGMIVRNPDGSAFHARGHTPDIEVAPTIPDLRDGKDTVLLRALAELR